MKIRNGFVSNSSSSSFVVLLPNDLKDFTLKDLTEECHSNLLDYYDGTEEDEEKIYAEGLEKINEGLALLKSGDDFYQWDNDTGVFNCLVELLDPYVIKQMDSGGGDGEGIITPADNKKLKRIK